MSNIFNNNQAVQELISISANNILEKIRPLRQGINKELTAQRLIWELVQNAKDNVVKSNAKHEKFSIEINLTQSVFEFTHNYGYFSSDDLRNLIRRTSSKNQLDNKQELSITGRFGTGFMTTHLLSEMVNINGVYNDESTHSFKEFEFLLDRTGKDHSEMAACVERSMNAVEQSIQTSNLVSLGQEFFSTKFSYKLNSEGYALAKKAIEGLENTIAYSLIAHQNVKEIICNTEIKKLHYRLEHFETIHGDNVAIDVFKLLIVGSGEIKYYATIKEENTSISFPIDIKNCHYYLLPIEDSTPKIYLDFALIGTEGFQLPFVVNSSDFEPAEARDGISLSSSDDPETQRNVIAFGLAINLFKKFIDYIEDQDNWHNLFHSVQFNAPKNKDWVDTLWFNRFFKSPCYEYLRTKNIIETENRGRLALNDELDAGQELVFPYAKSFDDRERLWELYNIREQFAVPASEYKHDWQGAEDFHKSKRTLADLVEWVEDKGNIEALSEALNKSREETFHWLNSVLEMVAEDDALLSQVLRGQIEIMPNQDGDFVGLGELSIDSGINKSLKEAMQMLGNNWKAKLLHKDITPLEEFDFGSKDQDDIIEALNDELNVELFNEDKLKAACYLASLMPESSYPEIDKRKAVYSFCKRILKSSIAEQESTNIVDPRTWEQADKILLKYVTVLVADCGNVDNFAEQFDFNSPELALSWLVEFIEFLSENGFGNLLQLKSNPVLPNQNGVFVAKDDLLQDSTDSNCDSEELKNISALLGYDFREELLEQRIHIEFPEKQQIYTQNIANRIEENIKEVVHSFDERDEQTVDICRRLFIWMDKYQAQAEKYFHSLYETKHRLIPDDEIIKILDKASKAEEIERKAGMSLEQLLELAVSHSNTSMTSESDNETVSEHIAYDDDFLHEQSLTTSEKTRAAINDEAKALVLNRLERAGYQVPDNIEISYTIVDGITDFQGKSIKLVIKSAQNGFIYFTPREWIALTEPNTQLFVVTSGNKIHSLTIDELETSNENFRINLNTESFSTANLKAFAGFFKGLRNTQFVFKAPGSAVDDILDFGLNKKNLTVSQLTEDDKMALL